MIDELTRKDIDDWYAHAGNDEDYENFLNYGIIGGIITMILGVSIPGLGGIFALLLGSIASVLVPAMWLEKNKKRKLRGEVSTEEHKYGTWCVERLSSGARIDRRLRGLGETSNDSK